MQLLDLPFTRMLGVDTDPSIKRPRRVLQQPLLPGINLVRVNLVARRQLSHRRLLPQRLKAIFAFSAASIFRLGFFLIRSVYHDRAGRSPIKPPVPKSGSTSTDRARVISVREDRAAADRPMMGAVLVEWIRKGVDRRPTGRRGCCPRQRRDADAQSERR